MRASRRRWLWTPASYSDDRREIRKSLFAKLPLSVAVGIRSVPKTFQRVEKVVVGPIASPKHLKTQAKTLQNRGFRPLNEGQKRVRGGFSTRWFLFDSHIPPLSMEGYTAQATVSQPVPESLFHYLTVVSMEGDGYVIRAILTCRYPLEAHLSHAVA